MKFALGLVETKGLVAAIEAADAMAKAADVKIIDKEKVTGALMIIKVFGETAAVKASVDAGSAAAQRVGELISSHVIPRPDDEIDKIIFKDKSKVGSSKINKNVKSKVANVSTSAEKKPEEKLVEVKNTADDEEIAKTSKLGIKTEKKIKTPTQKDDNKVAKKIPTMEELVVLNVHSLRRIARSFDNFPIKGREISKANRAKLLDFFKELQ